nr:hypothetical protein [Methanobrevibacter arboriphilus]
MTKIGYLFQHFGCRKGWTLAISNNFTLLKRMRDNLKHKNNYIRYNVYFLR